VVAGDAAMLEVASSFFLVGFAGIVEDEDRAGSSQFSPGPRSCRSVAAFSARPGSREPRAASSR
jgi:hypothetical protein